MGRIGKGRRKWFSIDSKTFKVAVEGEGWKIKVIVRERSQDIVLWVHVGELVRRTWWARSILAAKILIV